jgi:hypothetical protein
MLNGFQKERAAYGNSVYMIYQYTGYRWSTTTKRRLRDHRHSLTKVRLGYYFVHLSIVHPSKLRTRNEGAKMNVLNPWDFSTYEKVGTKEANRTNYGIRGYQEVHCVSSPSSLFLSAMDTFETPKAHKEFEPTDD